jgi:hypothetical protein
MFLQLDIIIVIIIIIIIIIIIKRVNLHPSVLFSFVKQQPYQEYLHNQVIC